MTQISTFVFFDIETTGLPWQERNRTKVIELCLLAVNRQHIERSASITPVSKLTLLLNPGRKIQPAVVNLTGLTNEFLRYAPTFIEKSNSLMKFLQDLPKPICLVAHNGNTFDFKILLAECNDAKILLPADLLCVDTLPGFRKFLSRHVIENIQSKNNHSDLLVIHDVPTDDEDMWPELNLSPEDWQKIDDLCKSLETSHIRNDATLNEPKQNQEHVKDGKSPKAEAFKQEMDDNKEIQELNQKRNAMIENLFGDSVRTDQSFNKDETKIKSNIKKEKCKNNSVPACGNKRNKGQFTLSGIYKVLLNKDFNAHRAEDDCYALLECVKAMRDSFLPWMDGACKSLIEIEPLVRY